MQYRELVKGAPKVSLLGYGCMRFKNKGRVLDRELAINQMYKAYIGGVNYFDTAYIYHQGKSEGLLADFIQKYDIRKDVYIADKLPSYLVLNKGQIDSFFKTQLERLKTDYIDYYLMHMLDSYKSWQRLKNLGIIEFIEKKKKTGEIKYIGFSFHGSNEEFIKILEDYNWDFTQIQLNYLDENNQAGLQGLNRAKELGIGVVIMEPLRGGSLADGAPDLIKEMFSNYKIKKSPAFWGLRYVMNFEGVGCVLSGMNDINHIKENINVASITSEGSMNEEEKELINSAKKIYSKIMKVPCTGCAYCMPCPFGVDIKGTFADYNYKYFKKNNKLVRVLYIARSTGYHGDFKSGGNSCRNCKKCLKLCPQGIDIPNKLLEAHKDLDIKALSVPVSVIAKIKNLKK